jgi:cyclophilin family peptidyl-prolyl cis-trans isomerase
VLADLQALHPEDLQVIFRPYPLWPVNDKALLAAQAAEAAGAQGQFWAMHDLLFARYEEWVDLSPEAFQPWLSQAAQSLDLDAAAFGQALQEETHLARALGQFEAAFASGLTGVPTLLLDGDLVTMQPTLSNLEALLRLAQAEARGLPPGPPPAADPSQAVLAVLETSQGPIELALDPSAAPEAVGSFVALARQGWYDGSIFHRVIPGVLVETGDPTHTGLGGPAYRFADELDPQLTFAEPGMVALASEGPNSNGGIFFINLQPLQELNGTRTIFGRVTSGLDLLAPLPARDPIADLLTPAPLIIERVTILSEPP